VTAKIDSDRKRKKTSISSATAEEEKRNKKKKEAKMSSSRGGTEVRASHILIKHEGSRRKASWKDPEGYVIKNTTRESAVAILTSMKEDILSGKAKFEDLASRYSDCSSAKRGGDLGKQISDSSNSFV
jgi:peptidyl-prolyl cis-trans isomerase NIMA-interacting 1